MPFVNLFTEGTSLSTCFVVCCYFVCHGSRDASVHFLISAIWFEIKLRVIHFVRVMPHSIWLWFLRLCDSKFWILHHFDFSVSQLWQGLESSDSLKLASFGALGFQLGLLSSSILFVGSCGFRVPFSVLLLLLDLGFWSIFFSNEVWGLDGIHHQKTLSGVKCFL